MTWPDFGFFGLGRCFFDLKYPSCLLFQRLKDADSEPLCGNQVIDLASGACAQWFRIDGAVAELYDVAVVTGFTQPMALGFATDHILSFITHAALEQHS